MTKKFVSKMRNTENRLPGSGWVRLAGILLLAAGFARSANAQTFTRILDAGNPVVNDQFESGGGSWVDLDDDGQLELFVANGNLVSQNENLYWNSGGGAFLKVLTGPLVNDGGSSIGGTWGDYDNDGRLDLYVTNRNNFGNFLYHGEGDTVFTRVTTGRIATDVANSNSSTWSDLDGDGWLDLYVVNFGGADFLYRNDGAPGTTFTAVDTTSPQPGAAPTIPGAWADFDNDRDQDLLIGVAGSGNDLLHRNDGGLRFSLTTLTDGRATLGASWGDYDDDGDLDLVTASFLNQNSFLYRNGGAPAFALARIDTGPVSTTTGNFVGSGWGDFDNDGDLDLILADDGSNEVLFQNSGPPAYAFTRVLAGPVVTSGGNSFGCVWGDYDGDGALDLFVANRLNQNNFLFHNDGNANHWLVVRCQGVRSNRSGIGAKVRARAVIGGSPRWLTREVMGQTGYNSQNLDLHFGLGDATIVDSLRIEWPSGITDLYLAVDADTLLRVTEGSTVTGVPGSGRLDHSRVSISQERIAPAGLVFNLPAAGFVALELFDPAGRRVATLASGWMREGTHRLALESAGRLPSGVYFCRLSAPDGAASAKLLLVR